MKLSYIVPVYKVEQYLNQCVESILSQTMDDYEIILVDDGSPDNCPAICDAYKEKYPDIIRVIHKENGGLASARNAGLRVAKGDYIFFFDSDDFLDHDGVAVLYNKAVEYEADILQTTYYSLNETSGKKTESEAILNDGLYNHEDMEREICHTNKTRNLIFVWRNLYRRDFLIKNNIEFVEELRMIEDAPFDTLAFLKAERFVYFNFPIYCYRHRADSLQRKKYIKDYDKILELQYEIRMKYYTENCTPRKEYFENMAEYNVVIMLPILLNNIYRNNIPDLYKTLKRIGNSEMMRRSFRDYDINRFKSKSLDWLMTWFVEKKLYLFAHILCKKVLYK